MSTSNFFVHHVALLSVSKNNIPYPHKYLLKIPTDWITYPAPDLEELQEKNHSSWPPMQSLP